MKGDHKYSLLGFILFCFVVWWVCGCTTIHADNVSELEQRVEKLEKAIKVHRDEIRKFKRWANGR